MRNSRASRSAAAGLLLMVLSALLAACSPLRTFNSIVPKDRAASLVERGSAYGAHPRQRLDVYRPREGRTRAPVVVFLYGGRWRAGSRRDYRLLSDALAERGFVAVVPDYRLAPTVRFPAWVEDGARAVR